MNIVGSIIIQDYKKRGLLTHSIKSVFFVQIRNRFGFYEYSLGDARCLDYRSIILILTMKQAD